MTLPVYGHDKSCRQEFFNVVANTRCPCLPHKGVDTFGFSQYQINITMNKRIENNQKSILGVNHFLTERQDAMTSSQAAAMNQTKQYCPYVDLQL